MPKFQIELDITTYETLADAAVEELRQIPQQAAWMLMQALREREEKRGLSHRPPSLPSCTLDAGASYGP